jgi:hypothetical protein
MLSDHDDAAAELALMNALIKSLRTIPLSVIITHVEQITTTERLQTHKRRRHSRGCSHKSAIQKKN